MLRLAAFILLAGIALTTRAKRRPEPVQAVPPAPRALTPSECQLLFMRPPSKAIH